MKNTEISELIKSLIKQEPVEPEGTFRWSHNSFLCRYPFPLNIPSLENWRALGTALQESGTEFDQQGITLLSKHARIAGYLGWIDLADRLWPHIPEAGRGAFLAGLSGSKNVPYEDRTRRFIGEKIDSAALDAFSGCELAVNATLNGDTRAVAAILRRPGIADSHVPRLDRRFKQNLEPLSDRVANIVLEAALKVEDEGAVVVALEAGADPNANIWNLERSFNERFCALAYAIDNGTPGMINALLAAGASPKGTEYGGLNQPLFYALLTGQDELADRLLAGGASFESTPEVNHQREPYFGLDDAELEEIQRHLGTLIPLTDIRKKALYHVGHSQGGHWMTFLTAVADHKDDVLRLQNFAALGLDISLSAEEICRLIHVGATNCLSWLLEKHGTAIRDQALSWIRETHPDFPA